MTKGKQRALPTAFNSRVEPLATTADGRSRRWPDVVLLDVRMPGMSGIEACRRITDANPAVAVILLTAYEDAHLPESAEKVGAYCYLLKDGPPSIVVDMIRRAWRFRDRSRSA